MNETFLSDIITELCEKALADLRRDDPAIQAHAAHLVRLSQCHQSAISRLSPFRQRVVERYLDERGFMETRYLHQLYMRGFQDCVKLLRWLGLLYK